MDRLINCCSAATGCRGSPPNPPNGQFVDCNNKGVGVECTASCPGGGAATANCTESGYTVEGSCQARTFTLDCSIKTCALLPTLTLLYNMPDFGELSHQIITWAHAGHTGIADSACACHTKPYPYQHCTSSQLLKCCLLCAAYFQFPGKVHIRLFRLTNYAMCHMRCKASVMHNSNSKQPKQRQQRLRPKLSSLRWSFKPTCLETGPHPALWLSDVLSCTMVVHKPTVHSHT